jgi:predicted AlkP superfamily phosphohydrolase/phosphomutase
MRPRVLAIGLDGMDGGLVDRFIVEGRLPTLAQLRERSARFLLDHGAATRTGLAWEHFASGLTPEAAGRSSAVELDTRTYEVWQEGTKCRPFFSATGHSVLVFDPPYTDIGAAPDVTGIVGWGAHDPGLGGTSIRLPGIDAVPEPYPAAHCMYATPWSSANDTEEMGLTLVHALAARARTARWLLDHAPPWELGIFVTGECHTAAEAFWYGLDSTHPLADHPSAPAAAEAIRAVYDAVDRFVGELLNITDPEVVVAFSMGGMGANTSDTSSMALLPELLFRWATGETLLAVPESWRATPDAVPWLAEGASWDTASRTWFPWQTRSLVTRARDAHRRRRVARRSTFVQGYLALDWNPAARYREYWPSMRAFALPSFYDGRIRVNLAGREARGTVALDDYDRLCDDVEALVRSCVDPRTGTTFVRAVERATDPMCLRPCDADITIVWEREAFAFLHPTLGLIGPVPPRRTGGHTGPYGFAYIDAPGAGRKDHGVRSAFDVAPTLLSLLGVPPSGLSGAVIPMASTV